MSVRVIYTCDWCGVEETKEATVNAPEGWVHPCGCDEQVFDKRMLICRACREAEKMALVNVRETRKRIRSGETWVLVPRQVSDAEGEGCIVSPFEPLREKDHP
jgi:hypothetical protein